MAGQGWLQLGELALAFVLSALVGFEREVRRKSAGLRTHCLVGVSAALFMLVSKYGFNDVLATQRIVLDPSRVAAQVVSGIGFIGGGVIFMRRDVVRGLTTAASIWLTAALGMACGAGLVLLAIATTLGHFAIMLGLPRLARQVPRPRRAATTLRIRYEDGRGLLRSILVTCTGLRFAINHVRLDRPDASNGASRDLFGEDRSTADLDEKHPVRLFIQVKGKRPVSDLIAQLGDINGVHEVGTADEELELE